MFTVAVSAGAQWEPSSYEERFEERKKGIRLKDNNVWVYTAGFAKRFGMPERWINDELRGAEAVAYRLEAQNIRSCGFFGDPDNCRVDYNCTFDLYISDSDSKSLPWKTDQVVDYAKEDSSVLFLSAQTRSDQRGWIEEEHRYDRSRLNIGLDSMSWVSGPPREGKAYSASSDRVRVMAYDRVIFAGLDYIKLSAGCNLARRKENVRIYFQEEFPDRDDFGVTYEDLKKGQTDEAVRFLEYKREWWRRFNNEEVKHVVRLPNQYMARVNEYDRKQYTPKSLATELEKRLKGKTRGEQDESWWRELFDM